MEDESKIQVIFSMFDRDNNDYILTKDVDKFLSHHLILSIN